MFIKRWSYQCKSIEDWLTSCRLSIGWLNFSSMGRVACDRELIEATSANSQITKKYV